MSPDVQSFLRSVDKFNCTLSSVMRSMDEKFKLHNIPSAPDLSHIQKAEDYSNAGKMLNMGKREINHKSTLFDVKVIIFW